MVCATQQQIFSTYLLRSSISKMNWLILLKNIHYSLWESHGTHVLHTRDKMYFVMYILKQGAHIVIIVSYKGLRILN